jgi:hypothetical protein
MLKTCSVTLLALAMSIGVAQARHARGHRLMHVIPACAVGQPTAWTCNCSAGHPPVLCHPGQWCHPNHMMGVEGPECSRG